MVPDSPASIGAASRFSFGASGQAHRSSCAQLTATIRPGLILATGRSSQDRPDRGMSVYLITAYRGGRDRDDCLDAWVYLNIAK